MNTASVATASQRCRCATVLDVTKRFQELPGDWQSDPCCTWDEVWRRSPIESLLVIDIRDDIRNQEVAGMVHMPMGSFLSQMYKRTLLEDDDEVILFCNTDNRSAMAVVVCRALGYSRVRKINGGYQEYLRLTSSESGTTHAFG